MCKLIYNSKIYPGQMINILSGINPNGSDLFNKTMFTLPSENISKEYTDINYEDYFFGPFPKLIPCESFTDVVNTFYETFVATDRVSSFFGAVALEKYGLSSTEKENILANYLGIPEEYIQNNSHYNFILVKLFRDFPNKTQIIENHDLQTLAHHYKLISEQFDNNYEKDINNTYIKSPHNIDACTKFINDDVGTHYIHTIDMGDVAYQIFVYENEKYTSICNAMNKSGWVGANSLSFRYFTSSIYCKHAGKVNLLSRDSAFEHLRPLLRDDVYNVSESIFSIVVKKDFQKESCNLNSIVCTGACLRPISTLEHTEANVFSSSLNPINLVEEVSIQSFITRFGAKEAGPAYCNDNSNIPYKKLYSNFINTQPLSSVWSPFFSVSQMYVNLNELFKSSAVNKRDVKHAIITADVIEIEDDLDLSFMESIVMGCRIFKSGSSEKVPELRLSSTAWDSKRFYCHTMFGNCIFQDSSENPHRELVFDNDAFCFTPNMESVCYKDFFSGKFPVDLFFLNNDTSYSKWCNSALQSGLDTLLMSAVIPITPEAAYTKELKQASCESWQCISWLCEYTTKAVREAENKNISIPEELARLYAHCTMTMKGISNPADQSDIPLPQVPSLRYTAYEDAINRLLQLSKSYGEDIKEIKHKFDLENEKIEKHYIEEQRDENIKELARFMNEQNQALAKKEDDINKCHQELIDKKNDMINQLVGRENQLLKEYDDYSKKLETAQKALVDEVKRKQREEKAKATFEFVFSLTEAVLGIVTGSYNFGTLGTLKGAERTLKKWDAFLKYAESINKIIDLSEELADHITVINDLGNINTVGKPTAEAPNAEDWDIFMNECIAQVKPVEDIAKSETAEYISIVSSMASIGKLLDSVLAEKSQYKYDIFAEEAAQKVSKNQSDRLKKLSINIETPEWTPDTDSLSDLGQFDAILQQNQNQSLLKLVELLRLQNSSMTFYYLCDPVIITKYDIISIEEAMSTQALCAVKALETYPSPPTNLEDPIVITIENVYTNELLGNSGVEIQIPMSENLFSTLARVRINSIDCRIHGVKTDTGKCHICMESLGNPMTDRGLSREVLSYKTLSRCWHVVYDIEKDKTIIGTKPAEEWGTYFTKPTPFQKFKISIPKTSENKGLSLSGTTTTISISFMVEAIYSPDYSSKLNLNEKNLCATSLTNDPFSFLNPLENHTVTDGWDVVSFVSVDKINALWKSRWEKEIQDAYTGEKIFVQTINGIYEEKVVSTTIKYELFANLGAPWLVFTPYDNNNVLVNIPILDGNLKITTINKKGEQEEENIPIDKNPQNPSIIKTKCSLKKLEGKVAENSVCIQLGDHPFEAENIEIDPVLNTNVNHIITTYFQNEQLQPWLLGTLRLSTDIDYLKPKTFKFQTYASSNYPSVLALYILTITTKEPEHGMRRIWPDDAWIVSKDMDAAVYFSDSLFWTKEILPAIQHAGFDATPDLENKKLILKGTQCVYDTVVKIKHGYESSHNCKTVNEHAIVNLDMSKISLKLSLKELTCNCDGIPWTEKFPYQGRTPLPDPWNPDVSLDTSWDDVKFTCSFDNSTKASINKDTFDVTFEKLIITPSVTAESPEHKLWFLPLPQVASSVVDGAKVAIENKFKNLALDFKSMPMFAVSNVLFPESKVMEPQAVFFPKDLVIVGNGMVEYIPLK